MIRHLLTAVEKKRLCTDAARGLIPWSHARAIADFEPAEVLKEWGVD